MHTWWKISLVLSIFGFLKEFRPSEPFVFEFLVGEWRNVTKIQVSEQVYPVGTYSYLAQSVIAFLITDFLQYKPLIVVLGLSGVIVWAMLLWTTSLIELQILEVFYGTFMASEVAYYTYIYAKVPAAYYQQVTSHTRAAILAGRALSSILAQLLISLNVINFRDLNYITFAAMLAATTWSLLLPAVDHTIYFHRADKADSLRQQAAAAFGLMWRHLADSFANVYVLKWSLWWSLATCGFIQAQCYMQVLWSEIQPGDRPQGVYNGAVEACLTVLGFLGALFAGVLRIDWRVKGELAVTICSLLAGFILLFTSRTAHIFLSYVCYVAFGGLYHFMITIASSEIAKCIKDDSFGLVFGLNTFLALGLQSLMTLIVVSDTIGLGLSTRNQYFVYGIYHIVIAVIYIVIGLVNWLGTKRDYIKTNQG